MYGLRKMVDIMSEFNSFIVSSLSAISGFLMSEPAVYFVGIALLACVASLFHRIIRGRG